MTSASAGGLGLLSRIVRSGSAACSIARSASASVTEDAARVDRAVGIFDAYRERPLDGRAEKVELTYAIGVRGLDVLGLFGTRRDGEERAAEAEVIPRPILADIASSRRPDDLR